MGDLQVVSPVWPTAFFLLQCCHFLNMITHGLLPLLFARYLAAYTTPYANTLHRVKRLVHQFVGYFVEFTFDVHKLDRAVLLHEGLHLSTM